MQHTDEKCSQKMGEGVTGYMGTPYAFHFFSVNLKLI